MKIGDFEFEAVLFDMDATLIDSQNYGEASFLSTTRSFDLHFDEIDPLRRAWHGGYETQFAYIDDVCERFALDALEFRRRFWGIYDANIATVPLLPGVIEVLERLAGNCLLGIVSDSRRTQLTRALEKSILGYFDVAVANDDSHAYKPNPAGYLAAANRLAVPSEKCLVLEDSPAGVAAALNAGMTVWAVRAGHRYQHDLASADLIIKDLYALVDILGR